MKVSVCMIVRNEEANISDALNSIPESYEKIVMDTGSEDRTMEIAMKLGAKVSRFTWNHDFSEARNASIAQATGDYILILDADERLTEETKDQINEFISLHPKQAGTVIIFNMQDNEVTKHRMVRFFPNNKRYYFKGRVHEQLYDNDIIAEFMALNVKIIHTGYRSDQYDDKDKYQKYLEIYSRHLEQFPNDGYMLYQLGKLYFSHQQYPQARDTFFKALEQVEESKYYFPVMLVSLGYALKNLGQSVEAEELLDSYLSVYPNFPDLPFLIGLLAMDTGKIQNIETSFLKALEIGETEKYTSVDGVGSYKAAYNLGIFYELTGNINEAKRFYEISAKYQYKQAKERLLKI
ncbi:glycosyltransferase involved in cell wall biosynthesis [Paenibacillus sp. V4I3]|uniref:glycosyltransferase n=1 Tax=Paenibacillus sp. V4I3 TaxID=3042305 RepID=UPI002784279E|nr:glycosyltransferase [Paenibacillus sp. V4I3]MDQ0872145.1 glycosyltransferase involved in cell wall biosynthesis [Paenibacillus sp. V4I3]